MPDLPDSLTSPMIHWVADQSSLDAATDALARADVLCVDTEFVRRKTYYAEAGLLQIGVLEDQVCHVYLIDSTVKMREERLTEVLQNPNSIKVFHSVGEDLEVLRERYQTVPAPMFDTQIAAGFAGLGAMLSLSKLVEQQLGIAMDKAETTSDWLKRPLRAEQISYAALDVQVLLPIYAQLRAQLQALGRLDWVLEDCRKLCEKAQLGDETQPHHKIYSAQRFRPEQQLRLWKLLQWRQKRAMDRNLPKTWILENGLCIEIAKQNFLSERALQNFIESVDTKFSRRAFELWPILESCEGEIPPEFELFPVLNAEQSLKYKQLRADADAKAAALNVDAQLLATRKHLEMLAINPGCDLGWRGKILRAQ